MALRAEGLDINTTVRSSVRYFSSVLPTSINNNKKEKKKKKEEEEEEEEGRGGGGGGEEERGMVTITTKTPAYISITFLPRNIT